MNTIYNAEKSLHYEHRREALFLAELNKYIIKLYVYIYFQMFTVDIFIWLQFTRQETF